MKAILHQLPMHAGVDCSGDLLLYALDRREPRFGICLRNWLGEEKAAEAERSFTERDRFIGGVRFGRSKPPYLNFIEAWSTFDGLLAGTLFHYRRMLLMATELTQPMGVVVRLAPAEKAALNAALNEILAQVLEPAGTVTQ
jgi:hypothetical protein